MTDPPAEDVPEIRRTPESEEGPGKNRRRLWTSTISSTFSVESKLGRL